jgi:hypothetical protein
VGQEVAREEDVLGAAGQDDNLVINNAISLYRVNERLPRAVLD